MNLPTLKSDFEGIVGRLPSPPAIEDALGSGTPLENEIEGAYERFLRATREWQSQMLEPLPGIRTLFESARDNPEALSFLLNNAMPQLMAAIDNALSRRDERSAVPPEVRERLDLLVAMRPASRDFADAMARKWAAVLVAQREVLEDLHDRLKAIEWDFDPDARGGEAFEDADDLIASLRS